MFYYLYLFLLAPIYSLVSSLFLRDQDREVLLLRQQLLIMQRNLGRRPAYSRLEKPALLLAPCASQGNVWPRPSRSCDLTRCAAGIENSCGDIGLSGRSADPEGLH
jgi:hypothetical protein